MSCVNSVLLFTFNFVCNATDVLTPADPNRATDMTLYVCLQAGDLQLLSRQITSQPFLSCPPITSRPSIATQHLGHLMIITIHCSNRRSSRHLARHGRFLILSLTLQSLPKFVFLSRFRFFLFLRFLLFRVAFRLLVALFRCLASSLDIDRKSC